MRQRLRNAELLLLGVFRFAQNPCNQLKRFGCGGLQCSERACDPVHDGATARSVEIAEMLIVARFSPRNPDRSGDSERLLHIEIDSVRFPKI